MNRPLLLRIFPQRLRAPLYYWLYSRKSDRRQEFFADAPLHFAPHMHMQLCPTDVGHGAIAYTGFIELELSKYIVKLAKSGGLLVDVGANYGYFSLLWAGTNPTNRVIAFEASPLNQPSLIHNIALNGFISRIDVRSEAVGEKKGTLKFSLGGDGQTGWGGFAVSQDSNSVDVSVVTLDDSIPENAQISILKIDVEGADTWVLYGAERLFKERRVKNVFFEHNIERMSRLGIGQSAATDFLVDMGYKVSPLGNSKFEFHAWPSK